MRDSIAYAALRSLAIAFCVMIGICLGLMAFLVIVGALSGNTTDNQLASVHTEEILPNAQGERKALSKDAPVILQMNIDGIIGTEKLDTKAIRQQLIESREGDYKNGRVKGILLYINTPGGTVVDADGIYRALLEYKKKYKVPIYAYVDGLCASGGMYIAAAADKIFATDTSLIGSVGVIAPAFINVTKLLDKVGIEALTISAGKDKDAMNPLRPWKPGEDQNYRDIIDFYYKHFVNIVTTSRPKVDKNKLIQDYGAKIFPAPYAQESGLIDVGDGSINQAITELTHQAGIEDENYQVIRLENKQWWSSLFSAENSIMRGKVVHQLQLTPDLDPAFCNQFLYLYRP
jgi:protease-4